MTNQKLRSILLYHPLPSFLNLFFPFFLSFSHLIYLSFCFFLKDWRCYFEDISACQASMLKDGMIVLIEINITFFSIFFFSLFFVFVILLSSSLKFIYLSNPPHLLLFFFLPHFSSSLTHTCARSLSRRPSSFLLKGQRVPVPNHDPQKSLVPEVFFSFSLARDLNLFSFSLSLLLVFFLSFPLTSCVMPLLLPYILCPLAI